MSYEEAKELADNYNARFYETSAKESFNVEDLFAAMVREIIRHAATSSPSRDVHRMEIGEHGNKEEVNADSLDVRYMKSERGWTRSGIQQYSANKVKSTGEDNEDNMANVIAKEFIDEIDERVSS